jgi:outer membrane protein OmpA-like peptidoglycan-associated protein
MHPRLFNTVVMAAFATAAGFAQTPRPANVSIPLCPGLTVVTAVNQSDGDYESIKTIESISDKGVRIKYSVERTVFDPFSPDPPKLQKSTVYRTVRREDLVSATLYHQQFSSELPELIPGTTAIGTSTSLLRTVKAKGEADLGIFQAYTPGTKPPLDRNVHPNVFDNQMIAKVHRAPVNPVMLGVIVNDARIEVPTIHVEGDFFGDKSEFFFLDDEANPLTIRFRVGIDAMKDGGLWGFLHTAQGRKVPPDRDTLQVVKISYRCATAPPSTTGGGGGGGSPAVGGTGVVAGTGSLEAVLEKTRRADVYTIFFSFNSDQIREESEPTLKEIAGLLTKHPDWTLGIEGHTDSVASDNFNLDLSRRRAAAVKDALVKRYAVTAARLTTGGFGESRPKDTNDTLEGRARNRRVELVRLP